MRLGGRRGILAIVLLFALSLSLSLLESLSPLEILSQVLQDALDLPFCCNRLLNLPLIPRLSRFFSSFFHLSFPSFHLFVAPLPLLFFFSIFLLLSSSSPLLSPPFCTISSGLSPAPFAGERDTRRQVSNCLGSLVRGCFGAKSSRGVSFFVVCFSSRSNTSWVVGKDRETENFVFSLDYLIPLNNLYR